MDKIHQITTSLEAFLAHKEKNVLVIKGAWGVGKTYFWENYIKKSTSHKYSAYSYVSLFGISSLGEMQSSIFYNSSKLGNKVAADTIKEKLKSITRYVQKIPQIGEFSEAISILEKSLLKDMLICIDDIERKDRKLSVSNILGLISQLSLGNRCKFILILNDDSFEEKDRKEFSRYREKVIDLELEYSPSVEYNQEIVFKCHPYKDLVSKVLYPLNLRNIRILKHIRWNIEIFLSELSDFDKDVASEIIATTIVLTYIHHEPSIEINIKDLELIFSYRSGETEEQKLQKKTIRSLGYTHFADYEKELIKFIAGGTYDKKIFIKEITLLNDRQKCSNFQRELKNVWGLFNNNFRATTEEVVASWSEFLNKHVAEMSYREIEPMISIISRLAKTTQTSTWIDQFISAKIEGFSRKDIEFFKTLTKNPSLIKKLEDSERQIFSSNTIKNTLYRLVKNNGWSHEDEEFLNSHSEEQLFEWIENEDDVDFLSILRSSVQIFTPQGGDTDRAQFGTKLNNVVRRFADRSPVDQIRLKDFFGINIDEA
jgi:hypothetical protein